MAEGKPLLDGLRVLDVGTYIFGPAAATILGDFGAEVIKIEPPTGDPYRMLYKLPPMPTCEENYCWMLDGRNKKSIALDLRNDKGREILSKLVQSADVFVTNYHPSVLRKLRLGYEELQSLNDRLIYAHATGYGESGPEVEKPGFDMTAFWARSGMMSLARNADSEPCLSLAGMGDHPSSVALFAGVALALYARERTGKGTKVSTSLMASGAWANSCLIQAVLCGGELYRPRTRATAHNALVNHYLTRDGKRFILCCIQTAKDWPAICRAIGNLELLSDPRFAQDVDRKANSPELIAIFDAAFAEKDMEEWRRLFVEHGVTFSPVAEIEDLAADPQLEANGVYASIATGMRGERRTINSPINLAAFEKVAPKPAPELGADANAILAALGYDGAAIRALRDCGAVAK